MLIFDFYKFYQACNKYYFSFMFGNANRKLQITLYPKESGGIDFSLNVYSSDYSKLFRKSINTMKEYRKHKGRL